MELIAAPLDLLLFLFFVAIVAGFLDTLAGGGGLIAIPALIMAGVPPLFALGTNKLQGSMGTATSTYMMVRSGRVTWKLVKPLMLSAFLGSAMGTITVQFIDTEALAYAIPAALLLIAIYFAFSPKPAQEARPPRLSRSTFGRLVVPGIGFYDGLFGPGTGSFFTLAGVSLRGQDIIDATATAKTLNLATNLASLIIFAVAGKIVWTIGLAMVCGQAFGAWAGSHCLLRINPRYLRYIVVLMCLAMLARYAGQQGWFA